MVMGGSAPITYKVCAPYSICVCWINRPNTPSHADPVKFASESNQLG